MSPQSGTPAQAPPAAPRQDIPGLRGKVMRLAAAPAAAAVLVILLFAARAVVIVDRHKPPPPTLTTGLTTREIQARIYVDLAIQLRGADETVRTVSCTRESDTQATCVADMSGEGPGDYTIDVLIDPSTQSYEWFVVGRAPVAAAP